MANRDLNFNQEVTDVAVEKQDDMLLQIAEMGADLADSAQKAKIVEAASQAQIGFRQLDQQYRTKYEGDPQNKEGLKELADARAQLTKDLGLGISSLYGRQWNEATTKLAAASDTSNGLWAIQQNYKNIKTNVQSSLKNYLETAAANGQQFGMGGATDASTLLDYTTAHDALQSFAEENLGPETTKKLLDEFGEDYMKSAISGVAMTNPSKALKLLEDPAVMKKLGGRPEQYQRFKSAVENRAKRVAANQEQQNVINGVRNDSAPLMKNGGTMSYAQFATTNLSEAAREYYANVNGFDRGSGKRGGLTAEDRANYRLAIIDSVTKLSKDENMDAASVRVVQDGIFKAMNKRAISDAEGMTFIKQIVEPLNAKKEAAMSKFTDDTWFTDALGFEGVQDYFEKNVAQSTKGLPAEARRQVEVKNTIDKANLYDYYTAALAAGAQQKGVTVAELQNLRAPERKAIYAKAQTEAQKLFMMDKHPALRTMPDVPNMVYDDNGQLIQGLAGPRNVKATASAKPTFKVMRHKRTGEQYRVYPDGRIEKAQ